MLSVSHGARRAEQLLISFDRGALRGRGFTRPLTTKISYTCLMSTIIVKSFPFFDSSS